MTGTPKTIRATSTVAEALRKLHHLDVRHLPVVNEDDELVGMVSDRDLRRLPAGGEPDDLGSVDVRSPISEIMSSDVISVGTETSVLEIVDLMLDQKIGAVPVVDSEGVLVGIVSYVDLLRELGEIL